MSEQPIDTRVTIGQVHLKAADLDRARFGDYLTVQREDSVSELKLRGVAPFGVTSVASNIWER
jgi:uncharacterized protein YaeQ